jgi:hypothetical protein
MGSPAPAPLARGDNNACIKDITSKVVSKPRPRALEALNAKAVAVDNPGGKFLAKKFSLFCKKASVAMAADDPAPDVEATAVPACDESDDRQGRVVFGDRDFVEVNRLLAQQNMALAIVAQQNKQQELNAGDLNRSLEKQVDQLRSEKLHLQNLIQDLEDQLANINANLISHFQEYTDFLEESAEEVSWMVAGLQDEICQLKGSVNLKNITKLSTALDGERAHNNRLSTENSGLYDEIYRLHAAINKRRANKNYMGSKMEGPPTKELPSGTAGGEETVARDDSWLDDNVSLFPSSDDETH